MEKDYPMQLGAIHPMDRNFEFPDEIVLGNQTLAKKNKHPTNTLYEVLKLSNIAF